MLICCLAIELDILPSCREKTAVYEPGSRTHQTQNLLCFHSGLPTLQNCENPTDPCLSFGSTSLDIDPDLTILCGLGLLLLFLCYLVGFPSLPAFCKTKDIRKRQGRAKRRRKGGTSKGWRCHQRETEEKTKLISILNSPLGRHDDTTRFRQLLCPDPFCEVCNNATAEVNWLLHPEALEDATSSASPLVSTSPVTESSFTLSPAFSVVPLGDLASASLSEPSPLAPSSLSPNPMTPLVDFFSPSPLGHSLAPGPFPSLDSEFPVDYSSPQPLAFPPLLAHDTQTADPVVPAEGTMPLNTIFSLDPTFSQDINSLQVLSQAVNPPDSFVCHHAPPTLPVSPQPDCTLTVTQSKSFAILLKPVPENSPPDSPDALSTYVPTIKGIDHSSLSVSNFWWQAHTKDLFPSTLAQCDFNQEFLALHSSEASFEGDPAANLVEPGNLSFLSPDVLALLERQVQKRSNCLTWKEKEKEKDSFPKQLSPNYQLNSPGKMLESVADKHDSAISLPFWSSRDKPKELHVPQQYPKTLEDHLQQKRIQLFWGLPSLHSESLPSAVCVSGDGSSIFIFNGISNTSTGQESPLLPHPLPLSLPEIQPEPLPQTLPQPQPLPLTQAQPQAQPQSPLPVIPSSPLPQIRICGVCFHRPQNESESLASSEIQHLEWNILQKQQKSLWGLPSVVQRSQEEFCPSVSDTPHSRPSLAHVSVSILPGKFPLSDELRKKLEHHLRKRLIQHRWGLPRRIYDSVSLMMPPREFSEISELESNDGVSLISVFKGQSSKNLNVGLSQPGSFHEKDSEMLQLEEDVGKDQGHSQENGPKYHLLNDPKSSSDKDLGYDSEKDLNSQMESPSEKNSRELAGSLSQRQLENVLKVHLSKKFEEISEGRLPGTVHSSWHAIKQTLFLSVKSHTQIKQRSLSSSVDESYSLNTCQDLSFVDSSAHQMLETHIKRFRMRMVWGLPPRVVESIEIFKLKDASSQSLSHSNFPSSTNVISEVDSKSGGFKSFRGSSKSLYGNIVETTNSASVLDHSLPATSPVGKEGQKVLRQSRSEINRGLAEDVQRLKNARQTPLPVTHCVRGKASQRQALLANRYPPKLPAKQAGARDKPQCKSMSSSDRAEKQQGKNMEKSQPVSMPKVSREIFRAEELNTLQLKTIGMLTTSKPGSSQMINLNESKVETTVTTKNPPPKLPVPPDPKSLDLKEQLFGELKCKLENREHSQAQGQATDMSLASDNLTYKASLTHTQGVSGGDMGTSQVLHVHLGDRGLRMEQQQETWVPKHVLRRCQGKNFPPTAKRVSPLGPKAEELGGGDAGLGTSQPERKSFPTQEMAVEETLGSKSSQTLSQKGQPPSESLIKKRMKHFLQWLYPGVKCKRQEDPQKKGSPILTAQSRGLVKSKAAFTRTTEAQKIMTDIGKFLGEKLGCQHATDVTCSQEPLPSPVQFGKTQQKAEVQIRAEPVQGHPLNYEAPSCKVTNTKSCHQEAIFAGPSHPPSARRIRDRNRHPQKVVAFKDQLLCQKHPPPVPRRDPVPHLNPTCRHQAGQGPPAAITTAEGSVFRDLSLLFRQKMLLQDFHGGKFPTPK
uniref:Spermatogenesis-associated protein 31D4-like isoform X1 n=1 Tax=Camelus bactrianus TaxID=9837 RepID=A0A9W3G320_CAMBA|nr:spermatogenesis-associated protein 31D4-like isoform X1 [Camelus bactrianus]XP_045371122.1 spermatogenesis-associated protein 31D4-like isoform X1 [Camelus bactrianus]XP_045371123.1 spermatogenesis-associated protein 31D4-like isoform X1 [Camelus bactrianus]XP_045371124.1 spermatogenesis-associated protein 31D4-like isoform X1 [Camelus bactrianus]XP_045371125.1 spermatogenesis-associated protein 31D4-like isoform X1 [Camelus bactrianus]